MIANHSHIWGDWLSCDHLMIANHTIYGHNYSYHIRGDRSPLTKFLSYKAPQMKPIVYLTDCFVSERLLFCYSLYTVLGGNQPGWGDR